jgi:hypothetical protein
MSRTQQHDLNQLTRGGISIQAITRTNLQQQTQNNFGLQQQQLDRFGHVWTVPSPTAPPAVTADLPPKYEEINFSENNRHETA